jgi:GT2 family glycosyltransferase
MSELSIIIVNWNCLAFTLQCVASIRRTIRDIDYEVIVVDNASKDAPCTELVQQYPWVRVILSDENLGFGRANNLGAKQASGKYLFFLNPDTVLLENAVARMLKHLRASDRIGAVGCKLLNPDGTLQITCSSSFPTIANQVFDFGRPAGSKQDLFKQGSGIYKVQVVPGAAFMMTREAFAQVKGFNPAYFMYAEEVDLCHALHRAKLTAWHVGDAEVIHYGGQSTSRCEDGFAAVTMRQSVYLFFCQTRGYPYAVLYRLAVLSSALVRLGMLLGTRALPAGSGMRKRFTDRDSAWKKWIKIGGWALGRNSLRGATLVRSSKLEISPGMVSQLQDESTRSASV